MASDHNLFYPTNNLFPNVRACLSTCRDGTIKCQVKSTIIQPVTYQCLFVNLLCIPVRASAYVGSDFPSPLPLLPVISKILLDVDGSATIYDFGSIQVSNLDWSHHSPLPASGFRLQWLGPLTGPKSFKSPESRRLVDTLFGLLKLSVHAKSLEDSTTRQESPEHVGMNNSQFRSTVSCCLWSDQLPAVWKEVSGVDCECYEDL